MKGELFYDSEQLYAIQVIQNFFSFYGLRPSLAYMETLIWYANHSKYYKQASPYTIVYFADWFRKLIAACFVLEKAGLPEKVFAVQPGDTGMPDVGRKDEYMPTHSADVWNYMPRHLDIDQYFNPMRTLTPLRKYKTEPQWMKTLDDFVEYSLSNATIQGCLPPYNSMKIRKILLQVIEGCYLVVIRYEKYQRERHTHSNAKLDSEIQSAV